MTIAVAAEGEGTDYRAWQLAERLGLPRLAVGAAQPPLLLVVTPERLELRATGVADGGAVAAELPAGRRQPLLLRAALARGPRKPRIIDATAGLGQDAFALAEAGCDVEMVERSPVVAALLADGLERAAADPRRRAAAGRLRLHEGEAAFWLASLPAPDIVYLDPMYPRTGREGRKGKEMLLLRELLGSDADAEALLPPARAAARRRVVVKRPRRAPPLADFPPSGSLVGTTVRYDLYGPATETRAGDRAGGEGEREP